MKFQQVTWGNESSDSESSSVIDVIGESEIRTSEVFEWEWHAESNRPLWIK